MFKPIPLYFEATSKITSILSSTAQVEAIFSMLLGFSRDEVENYKSKEYATIFYGKESNHDAPRRYWAQPGVLGFDTFAACEAAFKAKTGETYGAYTTFLASYLPARKVVQGFLRMVATWEEEALGDAERLKHFGRFYAMSFLLTVWRGKRKEAIAEPIMKKEIQNYPGLILKKTSNENDQTYMIDYVILKHVFGAKPDLLPVAGISIKGLSWWNSNRLGTSTYQQQGEIREKKGHSRFKKEWKAGVTVLVSDEDPAMATMLILGELRPLLQKLEKAGKI